MATDQTPPRLKLILGVAITVPLILVALKFVFDSYFTVMSEDAAHEKLADPVDLKKLHEAEQKNLTTSQVPISAAMLEVAHSHDQEGRPAEIMPQASDDLGAMTGWNKLPRQFDAPPAAAGTDGGAAAMAPMPMTNADGGAHAMTMGDGGTTTAAPAPLPATKDGGATAPKH